MINPLYERLLVRFFGITENINEAGYILRDGRLLDLSGRHFISDPLDRRHTFTKIIQHHDLFGVNYQGFSIEELWPGLYSQGNLPVLSILKLTGAISLNCIYDRNNITLRTCHPFSEAQYKTILRYFEEQSVYFSYINFDGRIVDDSYLTFVNRKKIERWIEHCQTKKPSKMFFSSAGALASYDKVNVTPVAVDSYPSDIDLNRYPELKKRMHVYHGEL